MEKNTDFRYYFESFPVSNGPKPSFFEHPYFEEFKIEKIGDFFCDATYLGLTENSFVDSVINMLETSLDKFTSKYFNFSSSDSKDLIVATEAMAYIGLFPNSIIELMDIDRIVKCLMRSMKSKVDTVVENTLKAIYRFIYSLDLFIGAFIENDIVSKLSTIYIQASKDLISQCCGITLSKLCEKHYSCIDYSAILELFYNNHSRSLVHYELLFLTISRISAHSSDLLIENERYIVLFPNIHHHDQKVSKYSICAIKDLLLSDHYNDILLNIPIGNILTEMSKNRESTMKYIFDLIIVTLKLNHQLIVSYYGIGLFPLLLDILNGSSFSNKKECILFLLEIFNLNSSEIEGFINDNCLIPVFIDFSHYISIENQKTILNIINQTLNSHKELITEEILDYVAESEANDESGIASLILQGIQR